MTTTPRKPAGKTPQAVKQTLHPKPLVTSKSPAPSPKPVKSAAQSIQADPAPPRSASAKQTKQKKTKPVRDSFTMPKGEYATLLQLKQRGLTLAHPAKKSELIRAGIRVLAGLSDAEFLAVLKALPAIKTGRPSKADAA